MADALAGLKVWGIVYRVIAIHLIKKLSLLKGSTHSCRYINPVW